MIQKTADRRVISSVLVYMVARSNTQWPTRKGKQWKIKI